MESEIIAGIKAPDSKLAIEATELARSASAPVVFNHVMRSWLFAEIIGHARGIKYDRELVYVGAILHDLGLTDRFAGPERFEVDGANAARDLMRAHGAAEDRTWLVWDAIALHSAPSIAGNKQPEVAVVHFGISVDVIGFGIEEISRASIDAITAAFPRLHFKRDFTKTLAAVAARKPHQAFGNFLADVGERHVKGFARPNFCDLMESVPIPE
jgi:hypothetical protein